MVDVTCAMLHNIPTFPGIKAMPVGTSGRIVIEVDPDLKQELYSALDKEGLNLKQWFLSNAQAFLKDRAQLSLPLSSGGDLPEKAYS